MRNEILFSLSEKNNEYKMKKKDKVSLAQYDYTHWNISFISSKIDIFETKKTIFLAAKINFVSTWKKSFFVFSAVQQQMSATHNISSSIEKRNNLKIFIKKNDCYIIAMTVWQNIVRDVSVAMAVKFCDLTV